MFTSWLQYGFNAAITQLNIDIIYVYNMAILQL